jgi:hypothetical protein
MDLADLKAIARQYDYAKAERLVADRAARDLKTKEDELYAAIVLHCNENGGAGVDMGDILVEYMATQEPVGEDWAAIHQWIVANDAMDLVHKRLTVTAVKLRWDDDVEIPGIGRKLVEKIKVILK